MSDDKPKHKPQKKHTLSEVLKSLQDLIRTDLIAAAPAAPSAVPTVQAPAQARAEAPPLTPGEPDSFNDALEELDEIITHNIIEPVEQAKETPPEPLLPEETLEIEWDETEPLGAPTDTIEIEPPTETAPSADTIELTLVESAADERSEPPTQAVSNVVELEIIQMETKVEHETIDLDAPGADMEDDNIIDFQTETDETEAIELTALTDDVAPDTIELPPESVAASVEPKHDQEPAATAEPPSLEPVTIPEPPANPQQELFATYVAPPEPLAPAKQEAQTITLDESTPSEPSIETAAAPPSPARAERAETSDTARQTSAVTRADGRDKIPSLTVDFGVTQLSATLDDATAAKTSARAQAPPEPTQPGSTPQRTLELAAETPRRPEQPAKEAKEKSPPPKHLPAEPQTRAPVQQDIPVLKQVANLDAPPSAPLPSPAQARDIAIRVIAKLNIERRKGGEPPLDIKTIEKLQQYLTDALNKRTLNKPQ